MHLSENFAMKVLMENAGVLNVCLSFATADTDTLYHIPKPCKKSENLPSKKVKVLFSRDEVSD